MNLTKLRAFLRKVEDAKLSPGLDWPEAVVEPSEVSVAQMISTLAFRYKRKARVNVYGEEVGDRVVIMQVPCSRLEEIEFEIIELGHRFQFSYYFKFAGARDAGNFREVFFKTREI